MRCALRFVTQDAPREKGPRGSSKDTEAGARRLEFGLRVWTQVQMLNSDRKRLKQLVQKLRNSISESLEKGKCGLTQVLRRKRNIRNIQLLLDVCIRKKF